MCVMKDSATHCLRLRLYVFSITDLNLRLTYKKLIESPIIGNIQNWQIFCDTS
jgi:hypothetical protein